jgi:methyl-accepting chemotaxis protein
VLGNTSINAPWILLVSAIAESVSKQSLAIKKIAQMSEENHAAVNSNSQDAERLKETGARVANRSRAFQAVSQH